MTEIQRTRSMGVGDMTLFTVSAILILDTLAGSAAIGVASLTWWFILGILFLLPFSLINAELGTTYPEQGGIYAWVRDAFGARWGSRVTWLYWVNVVLWAASVYVLFAGVFAQMFFPEMSLTMQLTVAIAVNWLVVGVGCMPLQFGKWIPNAGAVLKLITFLALIVGGLVYAFGSEAPLANEFSLAALTPTWGSSMQYISVIIYSMLGFELISAASEELKDPKRDIPLAIFASASITFVAMVLGTLAVLVAIPSGEVDLVEGLVDTFRKIFGDSPLGQFTALLLGILTLFTFLSNVTTWVLGANRAVAEAAIDGELPRILALEHPQHGAPIGATLILGSSIMAILLGYGLLAGANENLFWTLLAASIVLFMLPYVGVCAAFLRARISDADRHRPYRVPGGLKVAWVLTILCISTLSVCIVFLMYVPVEGFQWSVIVGTLVAIALGEFAIWWSEKERGVSNESATF